MEIMYILSLSYETYEKDGLSIRNSIQNLMLSLIFDTNHVVYDE